MEAEREALMPKRDFYDAVVAGAGPNGLAFTVFAAIMQQKLSVNES